MSESPNQEVKVALEGMDRVCAELSSLASWARKESFGMHIDSRRRAGWESAANFLGQARRAVEDAYAEMSNAQAKAQTEWFRVSWPD